MPVLENTNEGLFLLSPAPSLISQTPLSTLFALEGSGSQDSDYISTRSDSTWPIEGACIIPVLSTGHAVSLILAVTTKISSEGLLPLFTKFSTPENYQPF